MNLVISKIRHVSPEAKRVIGNIGWMFVDRFLRMGVGLVVGVLVARHLGPEQFGLLSYATALVALFAILVPMGLDNILARDIVREQRNSDEILGTSVIIRMGGAFICVVLSVLTIRAINPSDSLTSKLVWILAIATSFSSFDAIEIFFQTQLMSRYPVGARNLAFILVTLIRVALIRCHAPMIMFAWANFAEVFLMSSFIAVAYRMAGFRMSDWRFSKKRAVEFLSQGWPMIISNFAIILYMKIDVIMIDYYLGAGQVGIYAAATRISEVWYFIPNAIVVSVFPSILRAKNVDEQTYFNGIRMLFRLMTGLTIAIAVPMTFLSNFIVVQLFGGRFLEAGPVLSIHIWAALFVFWGVAQTSWDLAEGLQRLFLYRTMAGAVLNIALNAVLLPRVGCVGAAIATFISYGASAFVGNALHNKTRCIFSIQLETFFFPFASLMTLLKGRAR